MKTNKYFKTLLVVICAAVFLVSGCREKTIASREKVTIAYTTILNAVLVHIAFVKGYFADEGLDVTPQPHAFGKPALDAVIDGKADLATVTDTPVVLAVTGGKKLYIIAVIETSGRDEAIVARQDRGISKPSDLKGKNIGVTLGTAGHFFADSFLIARGIDRNNVNIIDMKPDAMFEELSKGKVDAVSVWNPTLKSLGKNLGNKAITFYDETIYTETFCVAAGQEYVKKNPEAIKKFLRALIKAELFVKQNEKEARNLVAEFLKMDKALLDETWDIFSFKVTLDQAMLVDLEDQTRWALKNKLTAGTSMPNYLDYIYVDGLHSVKPEAVRIGR